MADYPAARQEPSISALGWTSVFASIDVRDRSADVVAGEFGWCGSKFGHFVNPAPGTFFSYRRQGVRSKGYRVELPPLDLGRCEVV